MPTQTNILLYYHYARRIIALASLVCFVAVLCYGVFLLMAVERAAQQQKYQSDARQITASLATLESQYLAQSADLTPQKATELGLVPVPANRVAYEEVSAPTLSMRQ